MGRFMVVTSDKPFEAIITYDGDYVNDPKDWVRLIRCKDCKHRHKDGFCFMWGSKTDPEDFCSYMESGKDVKRITNKCAKAIKCLPAADVVERKKGKWIFDGDCYKCNKCGAVYSWWADSQVSNYCPNCGARMTE